MDAIKTETNNKLNLEAKTLQQLRESLRNQLESNPNQNPLTIDAIIDAYSKIWAAMHPEEA